MKYTTEMAEEIFQLLIKIIEVPVDISNETDLRTYGLDSLKTMQLLVEIENFFKIEFDDYDLDMEQFSTLDKIIQKTLNSIN